MSETDIYKNKEQVQSTSGNPRSRNRRRKHRTSALQTFDKHDRKRRSTNAGFRRFLHLFRKSENEKVIWWSLLITIVSVLVLIAIWQFVYLEYAARKQSTENELSAPPADTIPTADVADDSAAE